MIDHEACRPHLRQIEQAIREIRKVIRETADDTEADQYFAHHVVMMGHGCVRLQQHCQDFYIPELLDPVLRDRADRP